MCKQLHVLDDADLRHISKYELEHGFDVVGELVTPPPSPRPRIMKAARAHTSASAVASRAAARRAALAAAAPGPGARAGAKAILCGVVFIFYFQKT